MGCFPFAKTDEYDFAEFDERIAFVASSEFAANDTFVYGVVVSSDLTDGAEMFGDDGE